MPRRKAGKTELRKTLKRTSKNKAIKQDIKKALKNFKTLVTKKDKPGLVKLLPEIMSKLDKAAKKGVINKNTARRKISRLALKIKSLA